MHYPNHSNRKVLAEELTSKGCYRLEKIWCKKRNKMYGPYGPYWYFYYWKNGKLRSQYIGKVLTYKIHSKKELAAVQKAGEGKEDDNV